MNKTKVLTIRIEENDLQLLQEVAAISGISTSKFVRALCRNKVKEILSQRGTYEEETENSGSPKAE